MLICFVSRDLVSVGKEVADKESCEDAMSVSDAHPADADRRSFIFCTYSFFKKGIQAASDVTHAG